MPQPQQSVVPLPIKRETYKPVLSVKERRAYAAAHRIMAADVYSADLACPGTKRSRAVDKIAGIIVDEMG